MAASSCFASPPWAAAPTTAVTDCLWLAVGAWQQSRDPLAGGIAATVSWLFGQRPAPVTDRSGVGVTRALAESERLTAQLILDETVGLPRFPAELECAALGVEFVAPRPVRPEWAHGVETTLRWLLGRRGVDGPAPPPLVLPFRRDDGSLTSIDELYERAVAAAIFPPMAHERREMYRQAEREVERSRRLDARIRALQAAAARSS